MGLGGIAWVKELLRGGGHFQGCMHGVSTGEGGAKREEGFDVVMVELMLRKRALVKGCQTLGQYARRWITLAEEQLARFPDARLMVFLFDDETNVPHAKGETQKGRRRNALTAEEQILLGPHRYLCTTDPREFDRRINALFGAEALRRQRAGRTKVSAFEIFAEKHMATSALREDEFEFATRCITAASYARLAADPATGKPACRIVVDRGVWRPSFERRIATDPERGGEEPWHAVSRTFPTPEMRALQTPPGDRLRLRLEALGQLAEEGREALEGRGDFAECVSCFERYVYMVRLGAAECAERGAPSTCLEARLGASETLAAEHRRFARERRGLSMDHADKKERGRRRATLAKVEEDLRAGLEAAARAADAAEAGVAFEGERDEQGNREAADCMELAALEGGGAREDALFNTAERAWVLIDETGVRRLDAMEGEHLVGEADLKIPRYARLFAGHNVFVVCHDSDLIPILLLVVKDWIPPPERARRIQGRLWLDMTTSSDLKKKPVPKGIVDVVEAWRGVHRWFAAEYPGLHNPVEVFCLLLILMGTDYVKNPPGMRAKTLAKGFEKLAAKNLRRIIATDGLMGGALAAPSLAPSVGDNEEAKGAEGGSAAAAAAVVRALRRDVVAGAFYETRGASRGEVLPPLRRHRYIAVHEDDLVRYLMELFHEVGPKDRRKWPGDAWWRAQARRLIWQMGYWYGGDTAAGRICDDEMLTAPRTLEDAHRAERGDEGAQTASMYGWEWHPVNDPSQYVENRLGVRAALERGRKRKWGSLGRYRPRAVPCESGPAEPVVPLSAFKRVRRERYEAYLGWLDEEAREERAWAEKKNTQVGFQEPL